MGVRFFFGLLAFIAAIAVVVLVIVSIFRGLSGDDTNTTVSSAYNLQSDEAVKTIASVKIAGPIVAKENYRELRMTVSQNARTIEQIEGYSGNVTRTDTLPNTPEAYKAFLGALQAARFTETRDSSQDPSTTCVTGQRFFYKLNLESESKVDTWTTSCSTRDGTFAGNSSSTRQLFQQQFLNYSDFTGSSSDISFN